MKNIVGLTLSESQAKWINNLSNPRIEARLESWKDHDPQSQYDSIISIGAFEFFAKLGLSAEEKIKSIGSFSPGVTVRSGSKATYTLQTVVDANSLTEDFHSLITKQIFPETDSPQLLEIAKSCVQIFEPVLIPNGRDDYSRTLHAWQTKLNENRDRCA